MDDQLKKAVIYQILVDRFSTGNMEKDRKLADKTSRGWMGGNLQGITKRIKYIKKLGVNYVYLTPILKSEFYDGYNRIDYFEIDPHFGTKKDFKKLVQLLHKNGIKILLDFVPNHCSDKHPFFMDAVKNPKSKYRNWFVFEKWPTDYLTFLDVKELPKFNFKNKDVRSYLIDVALYWIKNFDLDGLRVDHAIGPSPIFWKEFKKALSTIRKDIKLIAEAGLALGFTCGSPEVFPKQALETVWLLESFTKKEKKILTTYLENPSLDLLIKLNEIWMLKLEKYFDGFLDFSFRDIVWGLAEGKLDYLKAIELLEKHYKKFKKRTWLVTLLNNHDFNRFLYIFGREKTLVFSSFRFLIDQPALIYYGEESGLSQKFRVDRSIPYSKIEARRFMNWNAIDKKLFEHYRNLIKLKTS